MNENSGFLSKADSFSLFVFRIGKEWFALPITCFKQVFNSLPVHSIPHRSGKILRGLVNVSGELKLAADFHALMETENLPAPELYKTGRMVAIASGAEEWVFFVEEMEGIYNQNFTEIEQTPPDRMRPSSRYLKETLWMKNKNIGLLDEKLLFSALRSCLSP